MPSASPVTQSPGRMGTPAMLSGTSTAARRTRSLPVRMNRPVLTGQLGTLTLGAVTSAFADPLPSILSRFRATRPQVELRAHEVDTHEGVQALLDMTLDVAIIRYSGPNTHLRAHVLRHDHLLAALPAGHQHACDSPVEMSTLADEPWVWITRAVSPGYHDALIAACRRAGFSPLVHHHATSIHSQLAMVACGLGVALVPQTAALPTATVAYVPLKNPYSLVDLALVHRVNDPEPLIQQFVDCALACLPQLGRDLDTRMCRSSCGND